MDRKQRCENCYYYEPELSDPGKPKHEIKPTGVVLDVGECLVNGPPFRTTWPKKTCRSWLEDPRKARG